MTRMQVFKLIVAERKRQDEKWNRAPGEWLAFSADKHLVLAEEAGEVAKAILEYDAVNLREELIQVAAVCVAWLEADYDE